MTVKEQQWEFKEGQKKKVEIKDKGIKVKRSELVQWLKQSETWKAWESTKFW